MNSLTHMPEFLPLIESFWRDTEKLFHSTSAQFRFSKNLKAREPLLKSLSKEKFGELPKRTNEAFQDLFEKQKETLVSLSPDVIREETKAFGK